MTEHVHEFIPMPSIALSDGNLIELAICGCYSYRSRVGEAERIWEPPATMSDKTAGAMGILIGDWAADVVRKRELS